jgi:hypothetical protein
LTDTLWYSSVGVIKRISEPLIDHHTLHLITFVNVLS